MIEVSIDKDCMQWYAHTSTQPTSYIIIQPVFFMHLVLSKVLKNNSPLAERERDMRCMAQSANRTEYKQVLFPSWPLQFEVEMLVLGTFIQFLSHLKLVVVSKLSYL